VEKKDTIPESEVRNMASCEHAYKAKGKYYNRKKWLFGGDVFTVSSYKECTRCSKLERKIVLKKKVAAAADIYERQLKFAGIKPENQIN
jgi:hypothetical protein